MEYSQQLAILYGQCIEAAYSMYATNSLTPLPSPNFPADYTLTAWVQMQDFFLFGTENLAFYGFIAHSKTDPTQALVTIRGTQDLLEWYDDASSLGKTPFIDSKYGSVGEGWGNIYNTMEVIPVGGAAAHTSLKPTAGSFGAQVKQHLQNHAANHAPRAVAGPHAVAITGHSLGAALATLCAAENALLYKDEVSIQALYTFASPKVGDSVFVNTFNGLGLNSWRIANQQDVVPALPPLLSAQVDTLQEYSSKGKVRGGIGCAHAIATYLCLIDPVLPPDTDCQLPAQGAGA